MTELTEEDDDNIRAIETIEQAWEYLCLKRQEEVDEAMNEWLKDHFYAGAAMVLAILNNQSEVRDQEGMARLFDTLEDEVQMYARMYESNAHKPPKQTQ